jgi:hypothetical protein
MTWNLRHLARLTKDAGGVPAYGNQHSEWDAGCRLDFENRPPTTSRSARSRRGHPVVEPVTVKLPAVTTAFRSWSWTVRVTFQAPLSGNR